MRGTIERHRFAAFGRAMLVIAITAALGGWAAPAASAHTIFNRYSVVVTGAVADGGAATISVSITNGGIGVLNQLKLTAPSGFSVTGATTTRGTLKRTGNVLTLKQLVLLPQRSMTLAVDVTAPCGTSSPQTWSATNAKGILTFPFRLDTTTSQLTTSVDGACYLAFVAQPADSAPGVTITDTASDPTGGPVRVGLFDGADAPITTGAPVDVTVALAANPGGGTLSGGPTRATLGGQASFDDLSIDAPGDDYTLSAAASGFVDATSTTFDIAGVIMACEANVDCVASLESSDGVTSAEINAVADPSTPILTASWTDEGLDCDGYEEQSPSTLVFNVTSSREKIVTFTFDTDMDVEEYEYGPDPDDYQVCFGSENPFTDRFGAEEVTLGLLPDCVESYYVTNPPPCISDRSVYGSIIELTFITEPGDPKGRV